MKKRRLLNLLLTSVMFISSILTPQMAHVVASTVNGENAEDTEQVNENDMPDVDAEDNVKEDDNTKAGDGGEEITDVTAEGETAEDEIEVITTDEADTGEPEKDGKETRGSPEVENVDESEADETERESTFDEDTIPEEEHNVLIEGKVDGAWHELGRISFNKHIDTRLIDFSVEVDELRITKLFGVEFNLDQVLLNGNSPIGEEKKLANIDNDVIDVVDSQIFKFPTKGSTFSISGRIPLYLDPPETHAFHSKWMEQDLTDLNGAFDDGPTVTIPDEKYLTAKDYLIPSSGHPAGDLSLFMSKDSDFLYVFGKVELDNTFDKGKDYLSIHIVDSKNQEYKVSTTEENEYGRWWFEYTDVGVDYQHMQYLVKIPLSDLKNPNNIQYKYEYYGTASASMPVFMDIEKNFVDWESTEFTNEAYANHTYFQLTNKNNPDMNTEVRIIPAGMRIESFEMEKNLLYFNVSQLLDSSKEFHDTLMMKNDKAESIASKYFDFDREITFKDQDFEEFYKKSEYSRYDIYLALYEYSTEFRKHMDSYMRIDRYVHGFELKSEFLVPFINGEYVLNEIFAPSGYVIDTKKYPINLEFPLTIFDHARSLFDNVQSEEEFIKIFNEYIEQRIIKPINAPTTIKNYPEDYKFNLPVEKIWIDEDGKFETRPDGITIQLLANGKPLEGGLIELNAANDYKHTFEDLPKHTEGEVKEEIIYTVEEVNVPNGYTSKITGSESEGYTITNTLKNTSIKGKKVWIDESNQAYSRPETITIKLLANGQEVENGTVEISTDTDMEFSFENLPIFTADNEEIEYTIEEVNIPEGYTAEITGNATDGFTVTNTYTPEVVDISVQKIWDDADNQDGVRPDEITLNLLANGVEIASQKVTAEDDWSYTFEGLARYENQGEEIEYTIEEEAVEGYEVSIDGYDITNSYTPEVIDITGSKTWDDADNQDGIRPESITVNLLANGVEVNTVEVTAEDNWSYTFEDLPRFEAGEEITYTVTENTVEDYTQTIEGYTITNEYTPEETGVTVTKAWDDHNNQDGKRPDSIEVQLMANGEDVAEVAILSEEDNWTHTWSGLPLNENGEPIQYSVREASDLGEYTVDIDDENHGNIILTNSYTPEVVDIAGTKSWEDADNQDGIRPAEITVHLLANGVETDSQTVTAEEDWSYVFEDLPRYENQGEEIEYTVEEEAVEGYEATYEGYDIINRHTPAVIDIAGTKIWDDADNQDGVRPDEITLNLLANGVEIASQKVTAEDDWSYTFEGLARYENQGEEIEYTIEEEAVEGYEVSIDGYDITNSYTPEVIDITGSKTWDDADNQDGVRPQAITVRLLANGVEVDSVEVTEESDWTYEFKDIPKFENGQEIVYTVQEDAVKGYSTSIEGFEITNSHTPGQTSVNVVKSWNDNNNVVARPESITVNLLADGEQIDSIELTAENNWQADFTELDEYADGELIEYTVEEDTPRGFVTEGITGNAGDGFVITNRPAKVSVGDYVWFDANKDGLQDNTDVPLEGVVLTITDEEGNPVTDVYGNPVGPTVTNRNGWYTFDNLPIDNTYIVRINREAFEDLYPEYVPTLTEVGDDRSTDSSEWIAISVFLDEDGQRDPTLDFGFILFEEEPVEESPKAPTGPEEPEDPTGDLPDTPGSEDSEKPVSKADEDLPLTGEAATYTLLAVALLTLGGFLLIFERKLENR